MRRLTLTILVVTATLILPAPPAPASDEVCTGTGTMTTGHKLTYAALGPAVTTPWAFSTSVGVCYPDLDYVSATGVITGWCDFATGRAVTSKGYEFSFVVVGFRFVATGEMAGEATFIPDEVNGQACVTPGASSFLLWLKAAVMHDCVSVDSEGSVSLPPPLFPVHHHECA